MKKIVISSLLATSLVYATNGDNMIGVGAQSRAMGGVGIGMPMGTDSAYSNPAWVSESKGYHLSFGATAFMPTVHAKVGPVPGKGTKSKADLSIVPSISVTHNISDNLSYGVGMFGVSGMGVDYRNEPQQKGLANMRTALQYMRFIPSISYKMDDLRLGLGLTLAYGALSMSAVTPDQQGNYAQRGGGLSEDFGFGAQIGIGYRIAKEFTIGAFYQSQVNTEYEDVFDFTTNGQYDDLKLSQPAEAGIGIGYQSSCGCYTLGIDYRRIMWSDADGYDVFGWDDQDVIAIGGSYKVNSGLTLRAGYNYATSPLHNKTFKAANVGGAPFQAPQIAYFNTLGFPAYSDSHFTAGLSYDISKNAGLDIAYVYAPEVTEKSTTMAPDGQGGFMQIPIEASNEQNSITVAVTYKF